MAKKKYKDIGKGHTYCGIPAQKQRGQTTRKASKEKG